MLLGKLVPSARLACHSVSWGLLPAAASTRLLPSAYTAAIQQQCIAPRTVATHSVKPFGKFVFDGPGSVNVAPLSPQDYPDMDQCAISCEGDSTKWSVTAQDDLCSISSTSEERSSDLWSVHLPIKYDVDVRSAGAAAVSGMECSQAAVKIRGDVTLTAVRAGHVTVQTEAAVHIKKFLLANVSLEAEEVNSSEARLQGQTVAVSARRCCHLSDIYADQARVAVSSADLRMGTVHGSATVTAAGSGQVVIGGVDGSVQLSAPSAAVRCHIHRLRADSRLSCGGTLHLTLAPAAGCRLEVRGPAPDLDPRLCPAAGGAGAGVHTITVAGGGPLLVVESPQPAQVRLQDWAAAVAGWA